MTWAKRVTGCGVPRDSPRPTLAPTPSPALSASLHGLWIWGLDSQDQDRVVREKGLGGKFQTELVKMLPNRAKELSSQ